jgi:hypothetical protein
MSDSRRDLVSASEIASWEWCPESWRLDAIGAEPTNRADRLRGKRHHARTAWVEVWSRRLKWAGLLFVAAALGVIALYFAFFGTAR